MGFANMGPISQKGLPLYLGRYKDRKTGRLKLISPPNYLYNWREWSSVFDHGVIDLAYKWNQFVRSADRVVMILKKKGIWEKYIAARAKKYTLSALRRSQLLKTIKSVQNGKFKPFTVMSDKYKQEFIKEIKAWNYAGISNGI